MIHVEPSILISINELYEVKMFLNKMSKEKQNYDEKSLMLNK